MPIADNLKLIAQVEHLGNIAAGGGAAKNIRNVYHFRRTNIAGAWNSDAISTAFAAALVTPITNALNVDFTGSLISTRCVNDAQDLEDTLIDVTPGAIAGDRLPDFSAAVLILKSGLRGASYQGRKHYAPMSESDIGDDILNAGAVTRMTAIATAILAGFTDAGGNIWVPCVLSRTLSSLGVNPTNVVTADVLNILINKSLGTMRHRKVATVR